MSILFEKILLKVILLKGILLIVFLLRSVLLKCILLKGTTYCLSTDKCSTETYSTECLFYWTDSTDCLSTESTFYWKFFYLPLGHHIIHCVSERKNWMHECKLNVYVCCTEKNRNKLQYQFSVTCVLHFTLIVYAMPWIFYNA